jgi:uncharacterized membrane protein YvbJ
MKLKNSKKAVELPLNVIIIAALLLIVLIVMIAMFTGIFQKQTGQIRNYVNQLDDCDQDGTANMFDPCPCNPNTESCPGKEKLKSCEEGKAPECEPKK